MSVPTPQTGLLFQNASHALHLLQEANGANSSSLKGPSEFPGQLSPANVAEVYKSFIGFPAHQQGTFDHLDKWLVNFLNLSRGFSNEDADKASEIINADSLSYDLGFKNAYALLVYFSILAEKNSLSSDSEVAHQATNAKILCQEQLTTLIKGNKKQFYNLSETFKRKPLFDKDEVAPEFIIQITPESPSYSLKRIALLALGGLAFGAAYTQLNHSFSAFPPAIQTLSGEAPLITGESGTAQPRMPFNPPLVLPQAGGLLLARAQMHTSKVPAPIEVPQPTVPEHVISGRTGVFVPGTTNEEKENSLPESGWESGSLPTEDKSDTALKKPEDKKSSQGFAEVTTPPASIPNSSKADASKKITKDQGEVEPGVFVTPPVRTNDTSGKGARAAQQPAIGLTWPDLVNRIRGFGPDIIMALPLLAASIFGFNRLKKWAWNPSPSVGNSTSDSGTTDRASHPRTPRAAAVLLGEEAAATDDEETHGQASSSSAAGGNGGAAAAKTAAAAGTPNAAPQPSGSPLFKANGPAPAEGAEGSGSGGLPIPTPLTRLGSEGSGVGNGGGAGVGPEGSPLTSWARVDGTSASAATTPVEGAREEPPSTSMLLK